MSFLRIGANGPLLKLASGGYINTSTTPPLQNAPGVVTTLAASSVTQTGLTLQWSASTGATPIAYAIYQKLHGSSLYGGIGTTSNTTFTVTGLQSATQYDFYVVASNSVGTAANGNVVSPTTASSGTAPGQVTVLTISSVTFVGFTLTWSAPTGTQPITYTPQYKLTSDTNWTSASTTTSLTANITGLSQNTQYDARVLAANNAGATSSGAIQSAMTTTSGSDTAPAGTLTLQTPTMTPNGATIAFAPLTTGTNIRYKIQYKLHTNSTFIDGPITVGTPVALGGLNNLAAYDFQLIAFNNSSTTVTSNTVQGTTLAGSTSASTLSDIVLVQSSPLNLTDPGPAFWVYVGYLEPVGGVGPYSWLMTNETIDGVSQNQPRLGIWAEQTDFYGGPIDYRPAVRIYSQEALSFIGKVVTATFKCTDARGVVVTKTVTINKTDGASDSIYTNVRTTYDTSSYDAYFGTPYIQIGAGGPTWQNGWNGVDEAAFDVTLNAPSTLWDFDTSGRIRPHSALVPGNYHLRVHLQASGTTTLTPFDVNLTVVDVASIQSHLELANLISNLNSSMPVGTLVGTMCCTTPSNYPRYSINDSSGYFGIEPLSGRIHIAQSVPAGDHGFSVTVTDRTFTRTDTFTLTVAAGTTVASSNMTMSVAQNLTNWQYQAEITPRAVGTPSITGMSGTPKWTISDQQRKNYFQDTGSLSYTPQYGEARGGAQSDGTYKGYQRIQCDPDTGHVFVMAHLSAADGVTGEWFDLTATSGTQVCTKRFYIPVTAVVGPTYHIGQGMSTNAPNGTTGFEHLRDFLVLPNIVNWEGDIGSNAGATVNIHWNSDPNYYANDVIQDWTRNRQGINGPLSFIGVAGPQGQLPRLGDVVGSSAGFGYSDKGFFALNNGDFTFKNLELSYCHMGVFAGDGWPASNYQMSLIRQNSGVSGDIWIDNCDIHDSDVPIHTGNTDGVIKITNTRVYNGAGCTSQAGANQHNLYLGTHSNMIIDNLLTMNAADGHVFKARAMKGTITNSRFFDTERGSEFNAIDLPQGGDYTISNCVFEKAAQSQNPYLLQFNEEADEIDNSSDMLTKKQLVINDSVFLVHAPLSYCDHVMSFLPTRNTLTGHYASITLNNVAVHGLSSGLLNYFTPDQSATLNGHDYSPSLTNVTFDTTTYPAMDFSTPCTYNPGRPGWHDSVGDLNFGKYFGYFDARQMDPGVDEIRISASAAPGTVICTITAYGTHNWSLSGLGDAEPNINPWASGATWSFGQTNIQYTGNPWNWDNTVHANRYAIDASTGQLKVGSAGLGGAGCDKVLIRATARTDSALGTASGKIAENAFFIVKF